MFLIFLSIFLINLSASVTATEKVDLENISKFLNPLLRSIDDKYPETNDVAIIKLLKLETPTSSISDVIDCIARSIPDSMPFHLPLAHELVEYRNLRPSSLIIIVSNIKVGADLLMMSSYLFRSEYYSNDNKFVFVAIDMAIDDTVDIFRYFEFLRILNVIVIGDFGGHFRTLTYKPFPKAGEFPLHLTDSYETSVDKLFPNKLANLNQYAYKVMLYEFPPRVVFEDGSFKSPEIDFMMTVAEKQNATLSFTKTKSLDPVNRSHEILKAIRTGATDVVINTGVAVTADRSRFVKIVNTFDTDGFCVMSPHLERGLNLDFMFKPFDFATWASVVTMLVVFAVVWKLLNARSTHQRNTSAYFMFGFISGLLKQSIPFRDNRPMQKAVLVLTMILTSVMSCFYETFFIASMTNINYEVRVKTIDEMINRNYSYYVSKIFVTKFGSSDHFKRIEPNIIGYIDESNLADVDTALRNYGVVSTCSDIDYALSEKISSKESVNFKDYYYKVQHQLFRFDLGFHTSFITYFHKSLQELSLRVSETGLRSFWTKKRYLNKPETVPDDALFLNLEDIMPAFYILATGLLISTFCLVAEIFWEDVKGLVLYLLAKLRSFTRQIIRK